MVDNNTFKNNQLNQFKTVTDTYKQLHADT